MNPEEIGIGIAIIVVLGALSYFRRVLDLKGTLSAVVMGSIILILGSVYLLLGMALFLFSSFLVTKLGSERKRKIADYSITRTGDNVLYNGIVPTLICLAMPAIGDPRLISLLFLSAVSAANSDTWASEIGVLSKNAYMIIGLKRVKPGVNGAVSPLGLFSSAAGAMVIGAYSLISLPKIYFLIISLSGFVGSLADSLLGETLENKGYLNKHSVNALCTLVGTVFSLGLYSALGL